mgnify:CR=1 FL=1
MVSLVEDTHILKVISVLSHRWEASETLLNRTFYNFVCLFSVVFLQKTTTNIKKVKILHFLCFFMFLRQLHSEILVLSCFWKTVFTLSKPCLDESKVQNLWGLKAFTRWDLHKYTKLCFHKICKSPSQKLQKDIEIFTFLLFFVENCGYSSPGILHYILNTPSIT